MRRAPHWCIAIIWRWCERMTTLAITGATGFVGRALVKQALAAGHHVRALTRSPQPERDGVSWIDGALNRPDSLVQLVTGADAVVHVAGVVNATDRAGFVAGNVDGTRAMLAAAHQGGVRRFVHVSSLSAREPHLSNYGWSKAEAETLVEASGLDWSIVRPSGVYGPGDTEMRDLFRAARWGIALLPPPGKASLVAVDTTAIAPAVYEVDDGHVLTHEALAQAIGRAVGRRRVLALHLPERVLRIGARIDKAVRGSGAKLTADRVGYLVHPDWTARPALRPPSAVWTPQIALPEGLATTARWYRAHGLL
jgi:nucleoside-diphosphate-sugar epimerase